MLPWASVTQGRPSPLLPQPRSALTRPLPMIWSGLKAKLQVPLVSQRARQAGKSMDPRLREVARKPPQERSPCQEAAPLVLQTYLELSGGVSRDVVQATSILRERLLFCASQVYSSLPARQVSMADIV